jgi:NAD(P)-dependent dehydrogenase (short-subunit alcohol dehydrogenase family)
MAIDELTALITGGTSGIGRVAAKKLSHLGIHVIVVGRSQEHGDKAVAEIRAAGGKADLIGSDLRDASSAREVARGAVELGYVDIRRGNCLPGDGRSSFIHGARLAVDGFALPFELVLGGGQCLRSNATRSLSSEAEKPGST